MKIHGSVSDWLRTRGEIDDRIGDELTEAAEYVERLEAALRECIEDDAGLYELGLTAACAPSDSDEEQEAIYKADAICVRAHAALSQKEAGGG